MKVWNEELDKKLSDLVNDGKSYKEIASLMNMSYKSVSARGNRIGLKSKYKEVLKEISNEECICKNCEKRFTALKKQNQLFCSQQCSGSYNTKGRKHSDETKEKIRKSLAKKEKIEKEKTLKEKKKRFCKNCSNYVLYRKTICEECRINYYKYYRPSCEFDFNLKDLKNKFDFLLIERYGLYSPSNKGNNLNGVSRDHLYSVKDGFLNKVDPSIIKHPANCSLIIHRENNIKHDKSSITLKDLLKRIEEWNK